MESSIIGTPSFWRYRVTFSKRGTVRFISHRDLMGVFSRGFRLAALPVRMSQGFNPRPRFSLPAPLPVGVEGLSELIELDLIEELAPEELVRRLQDHLPAGIGLLRAELIDPGSRAHVARVTYRAIGEIPPGAAEHLLAATELRTTRREGRELDIRPYLLRLVRFDGGCEFEVRVTNEGTARPAEILAALCGDDIERPRHLALVRTQVDLEG